ncbi:acetolactate decarboxylase [Pseudopelagicola sp. nBUS_20]|uniref:acetolactate decarboxylase n=1 Tax=Pseudopelagicola sp. nBUS_20 TaxID=3395317 RepID=UPI003EBA7A29
MAREVIDDRFIGALHLLALTRAGLDHDVELERTAIQTGTINALLNGCYEGDITIEELLRHGSDGIGTIQHLDGELIVVRGIAYTARADGSVEVVEPKIKTPFAVLTRFNASEFLRVTAQGFGEFCEKLDDLSPQESVMAIRARGTFKNLHLRSVAKQYPPFKPLCEVVADQTEWHFEEANGDIVGFRFPDTTAGIEVPGWHLHFVSGDRRHGGHIISLDVVDAEVDWNNSNELHVELPANIEIGGLADADRNAIDMVEARSH